MKKRTALLALMIATNTVFAQTENTQNNSNNVNNKKNVKKEAPCPKTEFAWGIGLAGLVVVGVVAGVTAGMAAGN